MDIKKAKNKVEANQIDKYRWRDFVWDVEIEKENNYSFDWNWSEIERYMKNKQKDG